MTKFKVIKNISKGIKKATQFAKDIKTVVTSPATKRKGEKAGELAKRLRKLNQQKKSASTSKAGKEIFEGIKGPELAGVKYLAKKLLK